MAAKMVEISCQDLESGGTHGHSILFFPWNDPIPLPVRWGDSATQAVATHLSHCWEKAGFHRPSASSSTEGYSQRKVRCYENSPQAASGFSSENCCVLYSRTSHCNQTAVRGWKDGFLRLWMQMRLLSWFFFSLQLWDEITSGVTRFLLGWDCLEVLGVLGFIFFCKVFCSAWWKSKYRRHYHWPSSTVASLQILASNSD